jgi:hypothetical protein
MAGAVPSRREAWVALAGKDLPLEAETVFPEGDGPLERRRAAARAKLLASLRPVLEKALQPGERVRYAARGVRYSSFEFYFSGYSVAYYSNLTALVLTDRRLLLLQVTSRGRPRDIKNQLRLAEVRSSRKRLGWSWEIRLADGTKLVFVGMNRVDWKALGTLLPRPEEAGKPVPGARSLEHLCPICLQTVPGPVGASPACSNAACRIPFRAPRRAVWFSTLVPGLGDLYLRHYLFGSLEFVGSMALLALGIGLAVEGVRNGEVGMAVVGLVVFLVLPRLIDHAITRRMAMKGLVPLADRATPGGARTLPLFPGWCWGLFAAGTALAAALAWAVATEAGRGAGLGAAREAAEAGRFDEAMAKFAAARAEGRGDDEAKARLALALYRAGDVEDGGAVVASMKGNTVEASLADEVNAEMATYREAFRDYHEGRVALVRGQRDRAWPLLDKALAAFRKVKRPAVPHGRGEVLADLAAEVLEPPVAPDRLAAAASFLGEAESDAPAAKLAVARGSILSLRGKAEAARAALATASASGLVVEWRLLALEARARVARNQGERQAVAGEAEAIEDEELEDEDGSLARRRDALLEVGKAGSRVVGERPAMPR